MHSGVVLEEQLPHDDLLRHMILQSDLHEPVDIEGPEAKTKPKPPALKPKKIGSAE